MYDSIALTQAMRNPKQQPDVAKLKARAAGRAAATKGRKTTFANRKRKANKLACRKQNHNENH